MFACKVIKKKWDKLLKKIKINNVYGAYSFIDSLYIYIYIYIYMCVCVWERDNNIYNRAIYLYITEILIMQECACVCANSHKINILWWHKSVHGVYHIYPTPLLGQNITQGQFLSGI